MKPAMRVVSIQQKRHLLVASQGTTVYGTTMTGASQMSRQSNDYWDDDEEE